MSTVPVSVLVVVVHALAALSVALADGVHVIVPVEAAVVVAPLAVPSVMVIVEPDMTIVELLNVTLAVV